MVKKSFLKVALMGVMLATTSIVFAQEAKTADELKAEREQLAKELKSKDAQKVEKTLDKLAPKGGNMTDLVSAIVPAELSAVAAPVQKLVGDKEARVINKPESTGLESVDALVNTSSNLLGVTTATDAILSEYKIELTDNGNGEVDITKYAANLDDYVAVLPLLVQAGVDAAKGAEQVKNVQNDVKSLSPLKAGGTIKAANWAQDALSVGTSKIVTNTKLLQNLISSIKASGNL